MKLSRMTASFYARSRSRAGVAGFVPCPMATFHPTPTPGFWGFSRRASACPLGSAPGRRCVSTPFRHQGLIKLLDPVHFQALAGISCERGIPDSLGSTARRPRPKTSAPTCLPGRLRGRREAR